jgi:hypothetical protein
MPSTPPQFLPQPVYDDIAARAAWRADSANQLPTNILAASLSRVNAVTDEAALLSGREDYQLIWLNQGQRISTITHYSKTTAAITPTHVLFGIRSLAKVLLAVTVDGLTTAWGANTAYPLAISTGALTPGGAYKVSQSGFYYVTRMVVAGTVPSLTGVTGDATLNTIPPVASATSADTGLTTTLPATGGALTPVALQVLVTVS